MGPLYKKGMGKQNGHRGGVPKKYGNQCRHSRPTAPVKGDVLNMYMDPDADARDIYGTVATISWVYYVDA